MHLNFFLIVHDIISNASISILQYIFFVFFKANLNTIIIGKLLMKITEKNFFVFVYVFLS